MNKLCTAVFVASALAPLIAGQANTNAAALADFTKAVKAYSDLRNKLDGGRATLAETATPAKIAGAEEVLAKRIREARPDAKPGDIFTPEVNKVFLSLLKPELKGRQGAQTKETIHDENPGKLPLRVNATYPDNAPLATVPPNILQSLPRLPEDIEYRFVGKDLILRDVRANLIIDFIVNALP